MLILALIVLQLLSYNIYVSSGDETNACPTIKLKKQWGGLPSKEIEYRPIPIKYVIIHHTFTPECDKFSSCSELIQNIQNYHMNSLSYYDIGYNFLVGNDGVIYEGTGWLEIGAHTYGYNTNGTGIAFIGNYREKLPAIGALNAVKQLLKCGVKDGFLDENYELLGGRQVIPTESPGIVLYNEIQEWDHWTPNS